jgi:hypothetical protein
MFSREFHFGPRVPVPFFFLRLLVLRGHAGVDVDQLLLSYFIGVLVDLLVVHPVSFLVVIALITVSILLEDGLVGVAVADHATQDVDVVHLANQSKGSSFAP